MKPVLEYAEQAVFFYQEEFPSITTLPDTMYSAEEKQAILQYLNNPDFQHMAIPTIAGTDVFTGERIDAVGELRHDGEYFWYDSLPEYVRLHDIALPDDFVNKVMKLSQSQE